MAIASVSEANVDLGSDLPWNPRSALKARDLLITPGCSHIPTEYSSTTSRLDFPIPNALSIREPTGTTRCYFFAEIPRDDHAAHGTTQNPLQPEVK
jgi:hypothetical protein